ncbi:MAG: hypothetical protein F4X51_04510 [Gemmatimonadetes bacterium]|nr:hypothetical protein [Gemmatimonadota bacterium]MYD63251.1 hypothetical protein [Gemmatimonadota bacterium]
MRRLSTFVCVLLLGLGTADADVLTDVTVGTIYDTNVDGVYGGSSAFVTQLSASVMRPVEMDASYLRFFFWGDGFLFGHNGDRTFATNRLGVDFARDLNSGERDRIFAGFSLAARANRSIYDVYDYTGLAGYVQGKWYSDENTMKRVGYQLNWRSYPNLNVSRYVDHYAFFQINQFLPSRTTLRGDLGLGYKLREGAEGQVVLGLQVAQSLTDNTGLRVRYQRRINLRAANDAPTRFNALIYGDDDILKDRYDYSGDQITARLTQQLPLQVRIILEGGYEKQSYKDDLARDVSGAILQGGALRQDEYSFFDAFLELPLTQRVTTEFGYGISRNFSNDEFYHYGRRQSVSFDLTVEF